MVWCVNVLGVWRVAPLEAVGAYSHFPSLYHGGESAQASGPRSVHCVQLHSERATTWLSLKRGRPDLVRGTPKQAAPRLGLSVHCAVQLRCGRVAAVCSAMVVARPHG